MNGSKCLIGLTLLLCCFSVIIGRDNQVKAKNNKNKAHGINRRYFVVEGSSQKVITEKDGKHISGKASIEDKEKRVQSSNMTIYSNIFDEKIRNKIIKKEKHAISLYEKALSLLNNSKANYKKAYTLLQESAKLNHRKAKEMVAKSHLFGDYLPIDIKVAKSYFESLQINQSSSAQLFLGFMHSIGLGVAKSPSRATMYYEFAAINGNILGQMALGFRHKYGISVLTSCEKALDCYRKIATDVVEEVPTTGSAIIQNNRLLDETENPGSNYKILDKDLIQYYRFLAKKGDVAAQVGLGQLYYHGGHGVDRDPKKALNFFRNAAKAGNGNAIAFLGKIYLEGNHEVKPIYDRALQYFESAAEKGNPVGQSGLGLMYLYGKGVDADFGKAFDYFSQSAKQGWVEGQLQLGLMYLNGFGVARDYQMAYKYFLMASKSNHVLGLYNLAQMHDVGRGTVRSCSRAVELFKSVAERGFCASILKEAYDHYRSGKIVQAFIKYAFLSELGFESASSNAAFILENHDLKELFDKNQRHKLAFLYWTRSAIQGYSMARVKLGDYHYYGYGTKIDYQRAAYQYKKASETKYNARALFNLGYMHVNGLGLKQDYRLAKIYYDLAERVSSEAAVPVALTRIKYKVVSWLNSFMQCLFSTRNWLGPRWDLYLVTVLANILGFIVYWKLRLA